MERFRAPLLQVDLLLRCQTASVCYCRRIATPPVQRAWW